MKDSFWYFVQKQTALLNTQAFNDNVLPLVVDSSDASYRGDELPSGYTQIEYLESTGSQCINTQLFCQLMTNNKIDICFEYVGLDSNYALGYHSFEGYATRFGFLYSDSNSKSYFHAGNQSLEIINNLQSVITIESTSSDYRNVTTDVYVDGNYFSSISGDNKYVMPSNKFNLCLFQMTKVYWGNDRKGSVKIKSCVIYDVDKVTPLRDYIPCFDSNHVLGLWDAVNSQFYYNEGTGMFNVQNATEYLLLDGNGDANNPYKISSVLDLAYLSKTSYSSNNYYQITGDIAFNDGYFDEDGVYHDGGDGKLIDWDVEIGTASKMFVFKQFDGKNHTLKNFYSTSGGLFNYVNDTLSIQNINFEGVNIIGGHNYVGTLINQGSYFGVINNIKVSGMISSNFNGTGGIVGHRGGQNNKQFLISNCVTNVNITARGVTGGITGYVNYFEAVNCVHSGNIIGSYSVSGLFSGNSITKCRVSDCENNGIVKASGYVAGILTSGGNSVREVNIINCTNKAKVSGIGLVGGICSTNKDGNSYIENCKNEGEIVFLGTGSYGDNIVAGICAPMYNSNIEFVNCNNSGLIYSTSGFGIAGGIVGIRDIGSACTVLLKNCTNSGNVFSSQVNGGLVGNLHKTMLVKIFNCMNSGEIKQGNYCGGIYAGETSTQSFLQNCYDCGKSNDICDTKGKARLTCNNCIENTSTRKHYFGTDFSAFFLTWKDQRIGLISLESVGLYRGKLTEQYLIHKDFTKVS